MNKDKLKVGDAVEIGGEFRVIHGRSIEPWFYTFKGDGGTFPDFTPRTIIDRKLKTLRLPIAEPWFSMILSGEKTEEYRDNKEFYWQRFLEKTKPFMRLYGPEFREYDAIHLTNGYGHDKPQLWAKVESVRVGKGNPDWGAPSEDVFIISIGEIFATRNLKQ